MEDASCGFWGVFVAVVGGVVPGGRYIASIVGRIAAPKGVDKKSAGKSKGKKILDIIRWVVQMTAPLIKDGIVPPVRNPIQSFVNELQLKSSSKKHYRKEKLDRTRIEM